MAKYFAKYSLLINHVELSQIVEERFIETSARWATSEVIQSLDSHFTNVESNPATINELRAYLQFAFSHLDHLTSDLIVKK